MSDFAGLASLIYGDLDFLEQEVENVQNAWNRSRLEAGLDEMLLRATALSLHAFYSGLERLFERIARQVDERLPSGESWHRDLVGQMMRNSDHRPAVIGQLEAENLMAYLGFRHVVRNIYTESLAPDRVEELVRHLPDVWTRIRRQLEAFAEFLEASAQG